jgi:hypothetical protein
MLPCQNVASGGMRTSHRKAEPVGYALNFLQEYVSSAMQRR